MKKIYDLALYILPHAILCVALVLLSGWLQMQVYLWPSKINEFSGLYMVLAAYVSPFIWFITLPFHLYFYYKKPISKNRLSTLISITLAILYFLTSLRITFVRPVFKLFLLYQNDEFNASSTLFLQGSPVNIQGICRFHPRNTP